jgi:late competence protein required for DNA uptake (superfamily II DNA/RNA helicase)
MNQPHPLVCAAYDKNLTFELLHFINQPLIEGEKRSQECRMKCNRCGSVMVYEKFYGPGGNFLGWRCIQCGEILDEVILKNRDASPGQHGRDRN